MPEADKLRIVIAGGGTGGHLYPGIALAQEFETKWQAKIMFIGTSYGIENKVLPAYPYKFKKIWMRGLHRKLSVANLLFPVRLLVSIAQCALIFTIFRPNVIIGTGGYVSGPALMAGLLFGVPTIIQEQNSYPGLVNRLLGRRVKQVHVTFDDSLPYFRGQKDIHLSGNPVRGAFATVQKQAGLKKFGLRENRTTLFVFGGSQGAQAINSAVLENLERLLAHEDLQVLWATGESDFEHIKTRCEMLGDRVRVLPFIDDMASAYAAADLVLCRAGASTLSEIAVCGLPAILIPYPFAAAGHQEFNARSIEKAGAAAVLLEKNLTGENLVAAISELLEDAQKRHSMAAAALVIARPKATQEIAAKIVGII